MPQHVANPGDSHGNTHTTRMTKERRADPATQLMVDEMILDYLLYMAAKAILQDRETQKGSVQPSLQDFRADLLLSMVEAFLAVFKANHPSHLTSVGLQCRLRLLQFTTLLMHRVSKRPSTPPPSTLETIRFQNRKRASVWLSHRDPFSSFSAQTKSMLQAYDAALPLSEATLSRNRGHVSAMLDAKSDPLSFYGLPSCPSLLDTLTGFMALYGAHVAMISSKKITKGLMSLAARYMTQSVLEQYLIYGKQGSEPLLEAFAWGFDAVLVAHMGSDEWRTNAMFCDEDGEVEGWEDLRNAYMRAFIPEPGESLERHLENLALKDPIDEFEYDVIVFLKHLLACQPKPILTQMETAELNGFRGWKRIC